MNEQSRVRLKGGSFRIGFLNGKKRLRQGRRLLQVMFPDRTQWIPEDQIEIILQEQENPVDLLKAGKFARPVDLRRCLTHIRLTGKLADIIYSMETTNTDFYPYQFKPVLRFLQSPSNALLIADEVGLGKTIEAGLIWKELQSRFDHRKLVVLCPAMLRDKWKWELKSKFGIKADIVNAREMLQRFQDPNDRMQGYALISSLEGTRPHKNWEYDNEKNYGSKKLARHLRSVENTDIVADLLIIDEAHYLRNPESQTHELGQLFRPVVEQLLLLTATPIHNYNQDLFSLLGLLDRDVFRRPEDLAAILNANRHLVRARDIVLSNNAMEDMLEHELEKAAGEALLRHSQQLNWIRKQYSTSQWLKSTKRRAELASRLEKINPLAYVITRTRKRDVKEWRVIREPIAEAVDMTTNEAEFYKRITETVIRYAQQHDAHERFLLATPQRQMSSSMAASLRAWTRRRDNIDDTAVAAEAFEEMGPLTMEICQHAPQYGDLPQLIRHDSKYARVRDILQDFFNNYPQEKLIIFSTFRETLAYLYERLKSDGIKGIVLHGGVKKPKDEILRTFKTDASIQVLLSSEVGSEGIDLQFCRVLINYDLPWNPMRVEQRIGRLDRLGQGAEKISIWNLFYAQTIDDRIYRRLYEKLDLCRTALGDFEGILGDEMQKLTMELLSGNLTVEQQEHRIDQTAQALENLKLEQEHLESQASSLMAYGDYILNQVHMAHNLRRWISGSDLRSYVTDFFGAYYPGCIFRQLDEDTLDYEIHLTPEAASQLEDFIQTHNKSKQTLLLRSSHQAIYRFENRTNTSIGTSKEFISQFHPLVQFVSEKISQQEEQLTPAVVARISVSVFDDDKISEGLYVLVCDRWSAGGLQTVEKLAFAARSLKNESVILSSSQAEQLANMCSHCGTDWFEARSQLDFKYAAEVADQLFAQLEEEYRDFVEDLRRQNEDRVNLQLENLDRHKAQQLDSLNNVLKKHRLHGRDSLVKATQGRIKAMEERISRNKIKAERSRKLTYTRDEAIVAIIDVCVLPIGEELL